MRKFLPALLFLSVIPSYARDITPQEAANVASEFLNSSVIQEQSSHSPKVRSVHRKDVSEPYYVFNAGDNQGFVIVSGNDGYNKILGYSDKGSFHFDRIPPQLKELLNNFSDKVNTCSSNCSTHPSWISSLSATTGEKVVLETANWDQGFPYNDECPDMGGYKAYTGCVATAMAIVMKYHNWPESYNWEKMPADVPENTAYPEIARLMKDIGDAVKMEYYPSASSAHSNYIGHAFHYTFGYSPECQFNTIAYLPDNSWLEMLKDNLDNGYPVIYDGSNENNMNGHSFVVDGYDSDLYHINWGWGGFCNGYFAFDSLCPAGSDFNYNNGIVLNIIPDKTGQIYSKCYVDKGYFWANGLEGECMNISVENIRKGEPFHIIHSTPITVLSGFDGVVGIAHIDKNGEIKGILREDSIHTSDPAYCGTNASATIEYYDLHTNSDVEESDRLQLVSKEDSENEYRFIYGTLEAPSSLSVRDNQPRTERIKFEIGEGIRITCIVGENNISAPQGNSEISVLKGTTPTIVAEQENPDNDKKIALTVTYPDKDENYVQDYIAIGIYNPKSCVIKASLIDLKDQTVQINQPGTLKDLISKEEALTIRKLIIRGTMEAPDFWYIRDYFKGLTILNLKDVKIVESHVSDGDSPIDYHPENYLPSTAFWGCNNIEELMLPDNLEGISDNALGGVFVSSIIIPEEVSYIGTFMFLDSKLKNLELQNPEPPVITPATFYTDATDYCTLYVPVGSKDKYQEAPIWKDFKNIIEGDILTKVEEIVQSPENSLIDIYSISGSLIIKNATTEDVNQLQRGLYILRQGGKTTKVLIGV